MATRCGRCTHPSPSLEARRINAKRHHRRRHGADRAGRYDPRHSNVTPSAPAPRPAGRLRGNARKGGRRGCPMAGTMCLSLDRRTGLLQCGHKARVRAERQASRSGNSVNGVRHAAESSEPRSRARTRPRASTKASGAMQGATDPRYGSARWQRLDQRSCASDRTARASAAAPPLQVRRSHRGGARRRQRRQLLQRNEHPGAVRSLPWAQDQARRSTGARAGQSRSSDPSIAASMPTGGIGGASADEARRHDDIHSPPCEYPQPAPLEVAIPQRPSAFRAVFRRMNSDVWYITSGVAVRSMSDGATFAIDG